jgi:hypothetical protein
MYRWLSAYLNPQLETKIVTYMKFIEIFDAKYMMNKSTLPVKARLYIFPVLAHFVRYSVVLLYFFYIFVSVPWLVVKEHLKEKRKPSRKRAAIDVDMKIRMLHKYEVVQSVSAHDLMLQYQL